MSGGRTMPTLSLLYAAVLATILVGCEGIRAIRPDAGDEDAGLPDAGPPDAGPRTMCDPTTKYIYTIADDNTLHRFFPPTTTFESLGRINCPDPGNSPFSMAIDRTGIAWVEYTDGRIFHVDTLNAACTKTSFVPNQNGFSTFGMGFSSNSPGSSEETLFVSGETMPDTTGQTMPKGLATIDTTTLTLTPAGMYTGLTGPGVAGAVAELTGTGDARLFGAFEGSPFVVAEIDKVTANILSEAPQNAIVQPSTGGVNLAFSYYAGEFWFFVGPNTRTDVFKYNPATNTTKLMKTVPFVIVGAGVSTCAPMR